VAHETAVGGERSESTAARGSTAFFSVTGGLTSRDQPGALAGFSSLLHVGICCLDQSHECRDIDRAAGPEFDMTHELARALEKARGIRKAGALKETDVDVGRKRVDVAERCVTDACRWMAIVQYLSNVVSTVTHDAEPVPSDGSKLARAVLKPGVDTRIPPDRIGEP
jgi:hypothetical protein